MTESPEAKAHEALIGEMLLLGLLSRILYEYPQDEQRAWLQTLIDDEAFSEAPFGQDHPDVVKGLDLLRDWGAAEITDESYKELQIDHVRLFAGPGIVIAPPWESVYFNENRQTFQERTLEVRSWYRRFGLESEKLYREPDDHIGLEISFLAHLAGKVLEAEENNDTDRADTLRAARKQFLGEHLLAWAIPWCTIVIEEANTDFYRGIGYLTRGALLSMAKVYGFQAGKEVAK